MGRNWWIRFSVLIFVTILAVGYSIPTLTNLDAENSKFPIKQKINLGLDLQGGLYLVLGVDFNKAFREIVIRQGASFEDRLKEKGITGLSVKNPGLTEASDDPAIEVSYAPAQHAEVMAVLKREYMSLRITNDEPGKVELRLANEYRAEMREKTINQSIEVIRNRIDEFGVAEPIVSSQGTSRIVVELPGVKEVDRAKELIGRTAKLEFRMVNDEAMNPGELHRLIGEVSQAKGIAFKTGDKFSNYVASINEALKEKLPQGSEIAFERGNGVSEENGSNLMPYLLFQKTEVTGEELRDASVTFNQQTQRPEVAFSLNPRGAAVFAKVTEENKGKRLAIVLDGIVHSAPVINGPIPNGQGVITLGQGNGDQVMKEARDLAIVLRAGALPAQLDFLEQRVTGPSLGQDSIRLGTRASVIGCVFVFLFILVYYRFSGAIAVASLGLNVLLVFACLVAMEATLTLPGIAGIALTVGIAVDSNVVIYERIREELLAGKKALSAVEAGFQKAFRTIADANVTNALAAIVLFMYGTGPIKGFAVSLLIGIGTTLFTAVFVCRLCFDAYLKWLERRQTPSLSI